MRTYMARVLKWFSWHEGTLPRRSLNEMFRFRDALSEKRIAEISKEDRVIRVYAHVLKTKPFIIDDGSGRALVNGVCEFREGNAIRVIGKVTTKESNNMPEIDPIVIKDMSKLDLDLYNELLDIKAHLTIEGRDGK
jgi:hypothetical protein